MYYVLFHYIKNTRKDFISLGNEPSVIRFLHDNFEQLIVDDIIEVKAKYRLGLVVTKDYVKSELEPEEEAESPVPIEVVNNSEAILREKKLKELKTEEASAMEKIADDIEKEFKEEGLTDEEKTKKALDDADDLIAREKEREKQKKKGWKLCTKCNSNRVAPWNKKKICSTCQGSSEGKRPYRRKQPFVP